MLAQILHDLYVPQEVLDELPEDQKQILFYKMREEQVRRYHQREQQEQFVSPKNVKKTKKKKQVTFRLGADGNEWCWVMGESSNDNDEQFYNKINNENMDIDYPNEEKQLKTDPSSNHNFPMKNGVYYTVHRDDRKHIEEISNNIQQARRIFELLESETQRLALSKENEILRKQQQQLRSSIHTPQSDFVDEIFYNEQERRARDSYHHQSSQLNICFDTNNETIRINSSNTSIEIDDKTTPAFPLISTENSKGSNINIEQQPTKTLSPITRADIRAWFITSEIPYGSFRSSNGQIYPWFHGIISRGYTEQILSSTLVGSYLIRISEKILGYVLSYRASDHCRHLLIEVIYPEHTYRFLGGAKKESFRNLNQLIEKYSCTPIRSNSTDVLRYPCGQVDPNQVDYADLFAENNQSNESLYISLDTTGTSSPSSLQSTTRL